MAAATQTFAIPEILEKILLILIDKARDNSLDAIIVLTPLHRVSRSFDATIEGSRKLQKASFGPTDLTRSNYLGLEDTPSNGSSQASHYWSPAILHYHNYLPSQLLALFDPKDPWKRHHMAVSTSRVPLHCLLKTIIGLEHFLVSSPDPFDHPPGLESSICIGIRHSTLKARRELVAKNVPEALWRGIRLSVDDFKGRKLDEVLVKYRRTGHTESKSGCRVSFESDYGYQVKLELSRDWNLGELFDKYGELALRSRKEHHMAKGKKYTLYGDRGI